MIDEMNGDIAFGVGMFHFLLSLIPPAFQWFLQLFG